MPQSENMLEKLEAARRELAGDPEAVRTHLVFCSGYLAGSRLYGSVAAIEIAFDLAFPGEEHRLPRIG